MLHQGLPSITPVFQIVWRSEYLHVPNCIKDLTFAFIPDIHQSTFKDVKFLSGLQRSFPRSYLKRKTSESTLDFELNESANVFP